jgi:uncharacterized protein (TIGR02996 family)
LRGIVENLDDDGPRLVYADWLDDHGDPERAEFIRVQCRLAEREQFADVPYNNRDRNRSSRLGSPEALVGATGPLTGTGGWRSCRRCPGCSTGSAPSAVGSRR